MAPYMKMRLSPLAEYGGLLTIHLKLRNTQGPYVTRLCTLVRASHGGTLHECFEIEVVEFA